MRQYAFTATGPTEPVFRHVWQRLADLPVESRSRGAVRPRYRPRRIVA